MLTMPPNVDYSCLHSYGYRNRQSLLHRHGYDSKLALPDSRPALAGGVVL